jgi:hypothetical protein
MKYAKPVAETAGKPVARSTTSAQSLFFAVGPTGEWERTKNQEDKHKEDSVGPPLLSWIFPFEKFPLALCNGCSLFVTSVDTTVLPM